MTTCNGGRGREGCGRDIIWAINEATGKSMPLDPNPIANGNVEATGLTDGTSGNLVVKVLKKDEAGRPGADRYRSHFATCPKAADFRRSK